MSANGFEYFLEKVNGSSYRELFPFYSSFSSPYFKNDFGLAVSSSSLINFTGDPLLYQGDPLSMQNESPLYDNLPIIKVNELLDSFSNDDPLGSGHFIGQSKIFFESESFSYGDSPFSAFLTFEKNSKTSSVILSSLSSGSGSPYISGFSFGSNSANKLFFEYYDPIVKDRICFTYPQILNNKNCIWLDMKDDEVGVNVYDFDLDDIQSFYYFYPDAKPAKSNNFTLGGSFKIDEFGFSFQTGNFNGWIDDIGFSNGFLSEDSFEAFASGAIYSGYITGDLSGYIQENRVTGYEMRQIPVFSGVTGQEIIETGVVEDDFGNIYSGLQINDLTGVIYSSGLVEMTGSTGIPVFYSPEEVIVLDNMMANSLGIFGINPIIAYDSDDLFSFVFPSSGGFSSKVSGSAFSLKSRGDAKFDRITDRFANYNLANKKIGAFLNGLFQTTGALTGSPYDEYELSSNDYFLSGGQFYSSGRYVDSDFLSFLVSDSGFDYSLISNFSHISGTGDCILNIDPTDLVFFNGQKVSNGVEFSGSGNSIVFGNDYSLFGGESGELLYFNIFDGFSESVEVGGPVISESGFFKKGYALWINGLLKSSNNNYIYFSKSDLLSGHSSFGKYSNTLLNNSSSFFFE